MFIASYPLNVRRAVLNELNPMPGLTQGKRI
jgi:D-alanine-D-alanine ligase-like ATP-grasp enzyme